MHYLKTADNEITVLNSNQEAFAHKPLNQATHETHHRVNSQANGAISSEAKPTHTLKTQKPSNVDENCARKIQAQDRELAKMS